MKTKSFFLITLLLLATTTYLSGCIAKPKIAIYNNDKDLRTTETQLAATADSVSKSLKELAEIDRAIHPQARLPSPLDPEMIGMGQLASIDWNGPVGPLVKKVAEATNYKIKILGKPPAIPILVSITAKDTAIADILRDIAFQCGSKANVVTYPGSRIIELRYAKS